eukprot:TRINITY_DN69423_c0_g1_i1.p1 TRINITY_DN69423_c0_g1~~TRINITY_DN69423_c0_g1_i1.p1  ORF type:complete len:334 (+),score=58.03 TRINITY_DN69423_c0_g1_i1:189-1190(+)
MSDRPSKSINVLIILCGIFVIIAGRWVPDNDLDAAYQPSWIEWLHIFITRICVMFMGLTIVIFELFRPRVLMRTLPFLAEWVGMGSFLVFSAGFVIQPDGFGLVAGIVMLVLAVCMAALHLFEFYKPSAVFPLSSGPFATASPDDAYAETEHMLVSDADGVEYVVCTPPSPPGIVDMSPRMISLFILVPTLLFGMAALYFALFEDGGAVHKLIVHIYLVVFASVVFIHETLAPPVISFWLPFLTTWRGLGAAVSFCGLVLLPASTTAFGIGVVVILCGVGMILNEYTNILSRPPPLFPSAVDVLPAFLREVPSRGSVGGAHVPHSEYDPVGGP